MMILISRGQKILFLFLFLIFSFAVSVKIYAQPYPTKTVKLIVPFAAGGNVDVSARILAQSLSDILGQSFLVENRSGAGGMIGGEFVARSTPDGYTLFVASTGAAILAPLTFSKPLWQLDKAFVPISTVGFTPVVIHVRPSLPITTVQELIAYARTRPGKVTVATGGAGSMNHMASELLQQLAGVKWEQIHHKGNSPAIADVLGGHIDVLFSQVSATLRFIERNQLRALATTGTERIRQLADMPTMEESGYKGFEAVTFVGVFAPISTPRAIVELLASAIGRAIQDKTISQKFEVAGTDPRSSTPDAFARFLDADTTRWRRVITEAGIKAD